MPTSSGLYHLISQKAFFFPLNKTSWVYSCRICEKEFNGMLFNQWDILKMHTALFQQMVYL